MNRDSISILESIVKVHPDYNYIAKDKNGKVYAYKSEPKKLDDCWGYGFTYSNHLYISKSKNFDFLSFDDERPFPLKEGLFIAKPLVDKKESLLVENLNLLTELESSKITYDTLKRNYDLAINKLKQKQPLFTEYEDEMICPCCGEVIDESDSNIQCISCGQVLDWSII